MRSTTSVERGGGSRSSARRALLGASLGLLLTPALPCRAAPDARWPQCRDWLADAMPGLLAELGVPGAQAVLLQDGLPAWSDCWGRCEQGGQTAVQADTVFEAASMSKPLFAYLVLQQVQAGRLALDRPVLDYLPEIFAPPQPWQALITARMLLTHTSGLPNWRPEAGPSENEGPLQLLFKPGQRYEYSGEGYFYLQRVLERLTGLPLEELARQQLFEPLGMHNSSFVLTPAIRRQRARGHGEQSQVLPASEYLHANSAYTLFTTAGDYALYLAELMRADRSAAHALKAEALQEMLSHQVAAPAPAREPIPRPGAAQGRAVFWGLGWGINTTALGDIVYHSGTNSTGFRCYSQFSPSRRSGLVLMSNSLAGNRLWSRVVAAIGDL